MSTLHRTILMALPACLGALPVSAEAPAEQRVYQNRLTRIEHPRPVLADWPEFIEPIHETVHYEAPVLADDKDADLSVRAWRYSYNARGIIEIPNRLSTKATAVICVHPWGIDDGQGWRTPEPAGVADFCTPEKNALSHKHIEGVLNPFLKNMRGKVQFIMYSQPGKEDPIRKKLYRSFRGKPTAAERAQGQKELHEKLNSFSYRGEDLPQTIALSPDKPVIDYFKQFPGIDSGDRYDPKGFWDLPIAVIRGIDTDPEDVMIYDGEGYPALREFLQANGIRHVLLVGYCADMCFKGTTAGYDNLSQDFNVFLVGDATLATFPSNRTPRFATNAAISRAAMDHLITQISWIKTNSGEVGGAAAARK